VRPDNQDAVAIGNRILTGDMDAPTVTVVLNTCRLLMIADGMGGHTHGAMASRALLDHLITDVDRLAAQTTDEAIREANNYLYGLMQSQRDASGIYLGRRFLTPLRLLNFNVGDSRAYLFTRGHLVQLSHDDVIDVGANPSGHRTSRAITQALGGSEYPVPITRM
jgi:protein phosphatase